MIGLGANLPDGDASPLRTLQLALAELRACFGAVTASRAWRTPAMPAGAGPDYVNAAATFDSALGAAAILDRLHGIEAGHGRERRTRWASRTLDLDLLAMGDAVHPDAATQDRWRALPPEMHRTAAPDVPVVPHPRMAERAFVLLPLAEVAPDWRHPRTGRSAAGMLGDLPPSDVAACTPIGDL